MFQNTILFSHPPSATLGAPIHKWGKKIERAADVDIGKIGVDKKRRPFGARRRIEGTDEGGEILNDVDVIDLHAKIEMKGTTRTGVELRERRGRRATRNRQLRNAQKESR